MFKEVSLLETFLCVWSQCFGCLVNYTLEQHGHSPLLLTTSAALQLPKACANPAGQPLPALSCLGGTTETLSATYCLSSPRSMSHPGPVLSLVTCSSPCALVWQSCRLFAGQRKLRFWEPAGWFSDQNAWNVFIPLLNRVFHTHTNNAQIEIINARRICWWGNLDTKMKQSWVQKGVQAICLWFEKKSLICALKKRESVQQQQIPKDLPPILALFLQLQVSLHRWYLPGSAKFLSINKLWVFSLTNQPTFMCIPFNTLVGCASASVISFPLTVGISSALPPVLFRCQWASSQRCPLLVSGSHAVHGSHTLTLGAQNRSQQQILWIPLPSQ